MSFYARLKKEVNGEKVGSAVFLGKRNLYPDDPRWMKREDIYLTQAKNDPRIEILETQQEYIDYNTKEDEEIENLVRGHWKTAQLKIEKMEDQFYLKKLLAKAQQLNKDTVAETIEKRLEFLNTPQYGKS